PTSRSTSRPAANDRPDLPLHHLIDLHLQGWTHDKGCDKCSPAVHRIDGPDEKLLAQLQLGSPSLTRIASTIPGYSRWAARNAPYPSESKDTLPVPSTVSQTSVVPL